MTFWRSFLLVLGLAAMVALPVGLSACRDQKPDTSGEREDAKKDEERKDAPQPPAKEEKKDEEKKDDRLAADFRLPDDIGGKLVSRIITPGEQPKARETTKPKSRPAPRAIENPTVPLPPKVVSLPRLSEASRKGPLPQLLSPEPLFGLEEMIGALPEALSLPAYDRVRLDSPDIAQPVSLPRMAPPLLDKPPFGDPTAEASTTATLAAPLPSRTTPAPFQRFTLPNPFENHDPDLLKAIPETEALPDTSSSPPRK